MARTLAQIRQQIEELENEAKRVRDTEVAGVVARIKTAIDFYGLTAKDLFGAKVKPSVVVTVKSGKKVKASKAIAAARYKDPASGKTWTGHGKRPGWFVDAIANGTRAEDLAIAP